MLGYLDAHLKNRTYVAGDDLTMGDIPMGCAIWRWYGLQIERPELPNLQRWFDNLRQRPAYQKRRAVAADVSTASRHGRNPCPQSRGFERW